MIRKAFRTVVRLGVVAGVGAAVAKLLKKKRASGPTESERDLYTSSAPTGASVQPGDEAAPASPREQALVEPTMLQDIVDRKDRPPVADEPDAAADGQMAPEAATAKAAKAAKAPATAPPAKAKAKAAPVKAKPAAKTPSPASKAAKPAAKATKAATNAATKAANPPTKATRAKPGSGGSAGN